MHMSICEYPYSDSKENKCVAFNNNHDICMISACPSVEGLWVTNWNGKYLNYHHLQRLTFSSLCIIMSGETVVTDNSTGG